MDSDNWEHDTVSRTLFGGASLVMLAVAVGAFAQASPIVLMGLNAVALVLFGFGFYRMRHNATTEDW